MERTLLIVDDDPISITLLEHLLAKDNYKIFTTTSCDDAFALLQNESIAVVISDQRMPNMKGTEFLAQVKELYPNTVRIILSALTDFDVVVEALNKGAIFKYFIKPWEPDLLRQGVSEAFQLADSITENAHAKEAVAETLEAIVITNSENTLVFANEIFYKLSGFNSEDILNKKMFLFDIDRNISQLSKLAIALANQENWQGEMWQKRKDESFYLTWLKVKVDKEVDQLIYQFIDITEHAISSGDIWRYL